MGYVMSLKRWEPHKLITEIDFNKCSFWIQIHNLPVPLPLPKRSLANVERIAVVLGELIDMDREDIDCPFMRNYVRMRVSIDFNKPLKRGFMLK